LSLGRRGCPSERPDAITSDIILAHTSFADPPYPFRFLFNLISVLHSLSKRTIIENPHGVYWGTVSLFYLCYKGVSGFVREYTNRVNNFTSYRI
jgi:hypothetical protein